MEPYILLLVLAGVCALWAGISAVLITAALDRRGTKTPLPLLRVLVFRNLNRYKEVTRNESGRVGPLFYLYVIPINLALILVLIAWVTWVLGR